MTSFSPTTAATNNGHAAVFESNTPVTLEAAPAISVVIGVQGAVAALPACLAALQVQAVAADAEIIVVQAGQDAGQEDASAGELARRYPQVRWLHSPEGTLVPQLWKQGIDAARGPLVALTIAQCRPAPDWLQQIAGALAGDAAAVGGPLVGPQNGGALDWALYFARYSAWMPAADPHEGVRTGQHTAGVRTEREYEATAVDDVAGDNAAYRRESLAGCEAVLRDGFWEVLVHERLVAQGRTILWQPAMQVEFYATGSLRSMAQTRFEHGRYYASTRSGNRPATRALRALTAPALPFVLLARIYGRVRAKQPAWTSHFWRSLPALSVLVLAWSLGEMTGYVQPQTALPRRGQEELG